MYLHKINVLMCRAVLSPTICVERKSIPDLVGSFASGRLFQQAEKMTRYYKVCVRACVCVCVRVYMCGTLFIKCIANDALFDEYYSDFHRMECWIVILAMNEILLILHELKTTSTS